MHLVGSGVLEYDEKAYITRIYRRPKKNGGFIHTVETVVDAGDTIVSDGTTVEEVVTKQQRLLPLALFARAVLQRVTATAFRDGSAAAGSLVRLAHLVSVEIPVNGRKPKGGLSESSSGKTGSS